MNTVKKAFVAIAVVAFLTAASSCNKHTCPTYSKAESATEQKA